MMPQASFGRTQISRLFPLEKKTGHKERVQIIYKVLLTCLSVEKKTLFLSGTLLSSLFSSFSVAPPTRQKHKNLFHPFERNSRGLSNNRESVFISLLRSFSTADYTTIVIPSTANSKGVNIGEKHRIIEK
ncbi:MAG: hypothetical protein NTV54_13825 [Ignavibacteriales bacterium]|nr:hypothetical protein [Ignavibacteriales bacterium]